MMNWNTKQREATASGIGLEATVADVLKRAQIDFVRSHNIKIKGPLGEEITVDFFLPSVEGGVYLECRRQETTGSADQKSAYIYVKVMENKYDKPVIVVVSGAESEAIYEFFKTRESRLMRCMSLDEFLTFCEHLGNYRSKIPKRHYGDQRSLFS